MEEYEFSKLLLPSKTYFSVKKLEELATPLPAKLEVDRVYEMSLIEKSFWKSSTLYRIQWNQL